MNLGVSPLSTLPLSTQPSAAAAAAQTPFGVGFWWLTSPVVDDSVYYVLAQRRPYLPQSGPVAVPAPPFVQVTVPWEWYLEPARYPRLGPFPLPQSVVPAPPFRRVAVPWEWYLEPGRQPPALQLLVPIVPAFIPYTQRVVPGEWFADPFRLPPRTPPYVPIPFLPFVRARVLPEWYLDPFRLPPTLQLLPQSVVPAPPFFRPTVPPEWFLEVVRAQLPPRLVPAEGFVPFTRRNTPWEWFLEAPPRAQWAPPLLQSVIPAPPFVRVGIPAEWYLEPARIPSLRPSIPSVPFIPSTLRGTPREWFLEAPWTVQPHPWLYQSVIPAPPYLRPTVPPEWYLEAFRLPPVLIPYTPVAAFVPFVRPGVPLEWYQDPQRLLPRLVYLPQSVIPAPPFVRQGTPREWFLDRPWDAQRAPLQVPPTPALVIPFTRPLILGPEAEFPYWWYRRQIAGTIVPPAVFLPRAPLVPTVWPDPDFPYQIFWRQSLGSALILPPAAFLAFRRYISWVDIPPDYSLWYPPSHASGLLTVHITGITRDSAGAPLGSCTVHLFRTSDDLEMDQTVSDGGGNFTFTFNTTPATFYIVAYLAGGSDVAGTTVNTLIGGS